MNFIDEIDFSIENSYTEYSFQPSYLFSKTCSIVYSYPGEEITYVINIQITNPSTKLQNVIITDTVPTGATLQIGSLTLNGNIVENEALDPFKKSSIKLSINNSENLIRFEITYKIIINTIFHPIRPPHSISSKAFGKFTFANQANEQKTISTETQPLITYINYAFLKVEKSASAYIYISSALLYTITITNLGNIDAESILLLNEEVPAGTSYTNGSFTLDGIPITPKFDIDMFLINKLPPNASFKISYSVIVNDNVHVLILSTSEIRYLYYYDPTNRDLESSFHVNSNYVSTNVLSNITRPTLLVDKNTAKLTDTLNYAIVIGNAGEDSLNGITFEELDIPFTNLIPNSVTINDKSDSSFSLFEDFKKLNIDIAPNTSYVIKFSVSIASLPTNSIILASCTISRINPETNDRYILVLDPASTTILSDRPIILEFTSDKSIIKKIDRVSFTFRFVNTTEYYFTNSSLYQYDVPAYASIVDDSISSNIGIIKPSIDRSASLISFDLHGIVSSGMEVIIKYDLSINIPENNIKRIDTTGLLTFGYQYIMDSQNSNRVPNTLLISDIDISFIKSCNKNRTFIGDTLLFTIKLTNLGDIMLKNLVLQDNLDDNLNLVLNSIKVDSKEQSPQNIGHITLGDVNPNQPIIIEFQTTVKSKPVNGRIQNVARCSYAHVDPSTNSELTNNINSNPVSIEVLDAPDVIFSKSVDKTTAYEDDMLTYTLIIDNKRAESINNLLLVDTIPENTTMTPDSITLNGIPNSFYANNVISMPIVSVLSTRSSTIKYKCRINKNLNNVKDILNKSYLKYSFMDTSGNTISDSLESTEAITTILIKPKLTLNYKVLIDENPSKSTAYPKSILKYSLFIGNDSNVDLYNISIIGTIPENTTLLADSIFLDRVIQTSDGTNLLANKNDLPIGETLTFTFTVSVVEYSDSFYMIKNINNYLTVSYDTNENGQLLNHKQQTTLVTTPVSPPKPISFYKEVNKQIVNKGETLTYSINITNHTGEILEFLNIVDTIPENCILKPNSFVVDDDERSTVGVGNVIKETFTNFPKEEHSYITYSVIVNKNSNTINSISNKAYASYKFANIDHSLLTVLTKPVETTIRSGVLEFNLIVNVREIAIFDSLSYSIEINNLNNLRISSAYIIIPVISQLSIDRASIKGSIFYNASFVENKLRINLTPINANSRNKILFNGIVESTGVISLVATINYKYDNGLPVDDAEYSTLDSNPAVTTVLDAPKPTLTKTSNKKYGNTDTQFEYKIVFTNTSGRKLKSVQITDNIRDEFYILPGSLKLNGNLLSPKDNNIQISLNNVNLNDENIINYIIALKPNIQTVNTLVNEARASYTFENYPNKSFTVSSGLNTIYINYAYITIKKSVNTANAFPNDTLEYTIELENIGNITAIDVYIVDTLDNNLLFIPDSLSINEVKPSDTINLNKLILGSLASGQMSTIKFNATVKSSATTKAISNIARVYFSYKVDPASAEKTNANINSPTVTTTIDSDTPVKFTTSIDKKYGSIGDKFLYTINFINPTLQPIKNITIVNTIPSGLRLEKKSVTTTIGSLTTTDNSITLSLPSLESKGRIRIKYNANISDMSPLVNEISSFARANYNLGSTATTLKSIGITIPTLYIRQATITLKMSVDKITAIPNDILTYTIQIINSGNIPVTEVTISSVLPLGSKFTGEAILINNVPSPGATLNTIPVGTINPRNSIPIIFKTTIESIPDSKELNAYAEAHYKYIKNLNKNVVISDRIRSNTVNTKLTDSTQITISQNVNKIYADIDDELTYTIIIENNSSRTIVYASLSNMLSENLKFIPNSISLNGAPSTLLDKFPIISLPDLAPKYRLTITFKAKVLINNNIILPTISNSPTLSYSFINSAGVKVTETLPCKPSLTRITNATLQAVKIPKNSIMGIGDIQEYTIEITNIGTQVAKNIVFSDILSNNLILDQTSLYIDNVRFPVSNLNSITLTQMSANSKTIIKFKATVSSLPSDGTTSISNTCDISYEYIVDPDKNTLVTKKISSNKSIFSVDAIPDVTINKTVDEAFADTGDDLEYIITITNNSNKTIIDNILIDYTPNNTTFLEDSLTIDGATVSGDLNFPGKRLPNLNPNQSIVISYIVSITQRITQDLLASYEISNDATLKYSFVDYSRNKVNKEITSQPVKTTVKFAYLYITKTVDKSVAFPNDILTYEIKITNIGNVESTSVIFTDEIPDNIKLITDSIKIDNNYVQLTGLTDVPLKNLQPNESLTILYKAKIKTNTLVYEISNTADFEYEYEIDLDRTNPGNSTSNKAITNISLPGKIFFNKTVDKDYCAIGDELTYNLKIENRTKSQLYNLNIIDDIPEQTRYIANSLLVDGNPKDLINNKINLIFDTVSPNKTIDIFYKVLYSKNVITTDYKISNQATAVYKLNPNLPPIRLNSNIVKTSISNAIIEVNRVVDKQVANINDILTFTISISNKGNIIAYNIVLIDDVIQYATFVEDSLIVNNNPIKGSVDLFFLKLASIMPNGTITVIFKVKITELPPNQKLISKSDIGYKFDVSPSRSIVKVTSSTETETLLTTTPVITFDKVANKMLVSKSEELIYTITIKNEGSVRISNINLIDSIPDAVTAKDNNNILKKLISFLDPKKSYVFSYSVITKDCNCNDISNEAIISYDYLNNENNLVSTTISSTKAISYISYANLTCEKSANKSTAFLGDIIRFTILITNTGNAVAQDVHLIENLPSSLQFIKDSLYIDSRHILGSPNLSSLSLRNISPKDFLLITLDTKVIKVPQSKVIKNISRVQYIYLVSNPNVPKSYEFTLKDTSSSNEVSINVNYISPKIIFNKTVNKLIASNDEPLTYTLNIENNGNTIFTNIVLFDTLPDTTIFSENSLKINGIPSPDTFTSSSISLEDLYPNKTITVTFDVTIKTTHDDIKPILNEAILEYSSLTDSGKVQDFNINSNTAITQLRTTPSPEKFFSYAQYSIQKALGISGCDKLILNKVLVKGSNISDIDNKITLSKGCIFNIKFSILLRTTKGYNKFKAALALNDTLIPASTVLEESYNENSKLVTLINEIIVKPDYDNSFLSLIYCSYSNKPLYILSASLTITEIR